MISIRMGKVCDDSICKPLKLILESCLESGKFPNKWKKANVVPIHKKGGKQILKNYQLEKFLRGYYMIACLSFLQKIACYQIINHVLNRVIHVLINFFSYYP